MSIERHDHKMFNTIKKKKWLTYFFSSLCRPQKLNPLKRSLSKSIVQTLNKYFMLCKLFHLSLEPLLHVLNAPDQTRLFQHANRIKKKTSTD